MHSQSMELMRTFAGIVPNGSRVLDVGAGDVGVGNYRSLFSHCEYVGLDITAGPNVDIVATEPYAWPIPSESFDFVISGQCLEHVEFPWETVKEMARVLKPKGDVYIIVPSRWPEHKYPIDCYRYLPDGMRSLAKWAGLEPTHADVYDIDEHLADCVGFFKKPSREASEPASTLPGECIPAEQPPAPG